MTLMKLSSKTPYTTVPETLSDLGLSVAVNPAVEIRVRYRFSKWWVQYRRPGRLWSWFWLTDSGHENFQDARHRAQTVAQRGGFETLEYQELHFDVDQYSGVDSLEMSNVDDILLENQVAEPAVMDWDENTTSNQEAKVEPRLEPLFEPEPQTQTELEPVTALGDPVGSMTTADTIPDADPPPITETVPEQVLVADLPTQNDPPPNFPYLVRGECIKVLDPRPVSSVVSMQGHENSYIVGIISNVGTVTEDTGRSYRAYTVDCIYDSETRFAGGELVTRAGLKINVPISLPNDYPGRIQKI